MPFSSIRLHFIHFQLRSAFSSECEVSEVFGLTNDQWDEEEHKTQLRRLLKPSVDALRTVILGAYTGKRTHVTTTEHT